MMTVQGAPWNTICAVCPLELFTAVAQVGLIQKSLAFFRTFQTYTEVMRIV